MEAYYTVTTIAIIIFGLGAFFYGKRRCGGIASAVCLTLVSPLILIMGLMGAGLLLAMSVGILMAHLGIRLSESHFLVASAAIMLIVSIWFSWYSYRLKNED